MAGGSDQWRKHAAPYLRKALQQASRTWKPSKKRPNQAKLKQLRKQRDKLNQEIKKEKNK